MFLVGPVIRDLRIDRHLARSEAIGDELERATDPQHEQVFAASTAAVAGDIY